MRQMRDLSGAMERFRKQLAYFDREDNSEKLLTEKMFLKARNNNTDRFCRLPVESYKLILIQVGLFKVLNLS